MKAASLLCPSSVSFAGAGEGSVISASASASASSLCDARIRVAVGAALVVMCHPAAEPWRTYQGLCALVAQTCKRAGLASSDIESEARSLASISMKVLQGVGVLRRTKESATGAEHSLGKEGGRDLSGGNKSDVLTATVSPTTRKVTALSLSEKKNTTGAKGKGAMQLAEAMLFQEAKIALQLVSSTTCPKSDNGGEENDELALLEVDLEQAGAIADLCGIVEQARALQTKRRELLQVERKLLNILMGKELLEENPPAQDQPVQVPTFLPTARNLIPPNIKRLLSERTAASSGRAVSTQNVAPEPVNGVLNDPTLATFSSQKSCDDLEVASKLRDAQKHILATRSLMESQGESAFAQTEKGQSNGKRGSKVHRYTEQVDLVPSVPLPSPARFLDIHDQVLSSAFDFNDIVVQFRVCGTEDTTKQSTTPTLKLRRPSVDSHVSSSGHTVAPRDHASTQQHSQQAQQSPSVQAHNNLAANDLNRGADLLGLSVDKLDLPTWRVHDWQQDSVPANLTDEETDFADETYLARHKVALEEAKELYEADQEEKNRLKEEERLRRLQLQQNKARTPKIGRRVSVSSMHSTDDARSRKLAVDIPKVDDIETSDTGSTKSGQRKRRGRLEASSSRKSTRRTSTTTPRAGMTGTRTRKAVESKDETSDSTSGVTPRRASARQRAKLG